MKDHYCDDTTTEGLDVFLPKRNENTCIEIKVKLFLFLIINEQSNVSCLRL